ncbi:flagellar filament capping protein FliD [Anaerotignum propionicum]|uniref:Flagellar hook-associated protein 2 n=1 Tax=Anaerotignum propionicum DSM 1682 TaxID=991789 RepID=A0A0X8VET8_ANAPI|nr:flagellar filament capping protein FliD [Anaerotignum propionicum]AMJ42372.1 flagellar hook-associated protein 2 [Anaerotignum propionicum DSM 1682]SHF00657.1 flagellar hook-associated protein 2 [[Clostridium] propionicum DSM 1682] [Anaerotignum propionicum DSM 1682]
MATISSLTSTSSSSNAYGSQSKGIGGLVSGLNTDELIDGMTASTRSKIAKQKQNKTLLSWKTDAYRAISDKLVSFANSYTSYSSGTNLYSANFYSRSVITPSGSNSKYVTASGSVTGGQQFTVNGIKQLAQDANFTTTETLSDNYIQTEAVNFGNEDISTILGKAFIVQYGDKQYTAFMPPKEGGGPYTNAEEVAKGMNKALENVDIGGNKTLASVMNVSADGETLNFKNTSEAGNALKIVNGDAELFKSLGIISGSSTIMDKSITSAGLNALAEINPDDLKKETTFAERMKGKSLSFEYNGTRKVITFNDETKLNETDFKNYLQDELDTAFGKGRIQLTKGSDNTFQFKTVLPSGAEDKSSVLYVSSSSIGITGEGSVFGIENGSSNKLNLTTTLDKSGLKGAETAGLVDGNEYEITINGESIKIKYEKDKTSLKDIIDAINSNKNADVNISYQTNSDSFSIVSTQNGASGSVKIGARDGDGNITQLNELEQLLFGKRKADGTIDSSNKELNGKEVKGQDAIILVDFDGEGGADATEISRSTNSFNLNGMKIVANGTFGYQDNGSGVMEYVGGTEGIKFSAGVDTEKVIKAIKSMIDEYNTLVEDSNAAIKEKRDRTYTPLTDEQRKDMSESEITAWEKKAKAGLLLGDSDISSLANDLRFVFMKTGTESNQLSDIGITVSSNWADNGKITLDETKLKNALQDDPERVKDLFTEDLKDNNLMTGGVMSRMKAITDKYAATVGATKGKLIEKAGNVKSPSSMLKNALLTEMNDIDKTIKKYETKLKTERTRYQNQFTRLEVVMQKMNTQSGWLSQYSGQ